MAIANQARSRLWLKVLVVLALALAALWWAYGDTVRGIGKAGTAYGVKNACSCRYISGRDLDSCKTDFVSRMSVIRLSEDEAARSVTASMPLIASHTATYREGFGCVLEEWGG